MTDFFKEWTFGSQLRSLRIKKGYTLRKYAKIIGMPPGNLSTLENGLRNPPQDSATIFKLVGHLGLDSFEVTRLAMAAFNFHVERLKKKLGVN